MVHEYCFFLKKLIFGGEAFQGGSIVFMILLDSSCSSCSSCGGNKKKYNNNNNIGRVPGLLDVEVGCHTLGLRKNILPGL